MSLSSTWKFFNVRMTLLLEAILFSFFLLRLRIPGKEKKYIYLISNQVFIILSLNFLTSLMLMYQAINMVNMVYLGILIFNEHFHVSSGMGEVPNNKKKGVGVGGGC